MCLLVSGASAGERISVLTLNVAGLPDFLTSQDNPEMRSLHIARRASIWDVVAYQEDFYYSKWLDAQQKFDTTVRGTKWHKFAFAWPWLRKSGLTIKTNWPVTAPRFLAYEKCHGYRRHGSDCWVPKGVLCMRMVTPGGVIVDFCTTHLDAGNKPGSKEARRHQIQEYLRFLPPPELDIPWVRIEAGDFNLRTHEPDIRPLLDGKDVIVGNTTGGNDVDYITVITNDLLEAVVLEYGTVPMFEGLSDHSGIGLILDLKY
jgi:endonuclease/exonuclease/phosphatase family metal-dependent hydrolase